MLRGLGEAAKNQPTFSSGAGLVEELGEGTQRTVPAVQQFLSTLRMMLNTGSIGLADSQHGVVTAPEQMEQGQRWIPKVGWRVDDEVWLLPDVVQDAVKRHLGPEWRWGSREFQTQLRGHLAETDGRNLAVKKSTSIGRARVWVLDARVVLGEVPTVEAPSMTDEQI